MHTACPCSTSPMSTSFRGSGSAGTLVVCGVHIARWAIMFQML